MYKKKELCGETDIENRLTVVKGDGGKMEWEFGISRGKLLL